MKCCNHHCNQGRTCPAKQESKTVIIFYRLYTMYRRHGLSVTTAVRRAWNQR